MAMTMALLTFLLSLAGIGRFSGCPFRFTALEAGLLGEPRDTHFNCTTALMLNARIEIIRQSLIEHPFKMVLVVIQQRILPRELGASSHLRERSAPQHGLRTHQATTRATNTWAIILHLPGLR